MDETMKEAVGRGQTATVTVRYRYMGGYHVFTSDDVYGLYIAHTDAQFAFDSVAPALEYLVRHNEGIQCQFEPSMSFREFLSSQTRHAEPAGTLHPAFLQDRQFILRCNN